MGADGRFEYCQQVADSRRFGARIAPVLLRRSKRCQNETVTAAAKIELPSWADRTQFEAMKEAPCPPEAKHIIIALEGPIEINRSRNAEKISVWTAQKIWLDEKKTGEKSPA